MFSRGGGNAGGRILWDGDSGWQKSFLMLLGPLAVSQPGAVGHSTPQPELRAAASRCEYEAVSLGESRTGLEGGRLNLPPSAESIAPSPQHQSNLLIFPSQPWRSACLMPFAWRVAWPVPGR